MVNVDRDLPKQEESEELVNAPLGFDLAHAESICSRCGGAVPVSYTHLTLPTICSV